MPASCLLSQNPIRALIVPSQCFVDVVLQLMAQSKNNQDVTDSLDIAEDTVKYHMDHILNRLGEGDRTQSVLLVLKQGIVNL